MNPLKVKDDYQKDKIGVFAIQYHVLACNILYIALSKYFLALMYSRIKLKWFDGILCTTFLFF